MDRTSLAALAKICDVPVVVALGVAAALLVIFGLVAGARMMPLLLRRTLEVQQHLASGAGPIGGVAVLGSSVVLEGVDCRTVAARLPAGTRCENLGWTAGNPRQWLLIEPALRRSPPAVAVLGIDLFALLHPERIPSTLVAMAAWWRFVPPAERDSLRGVLYPEELRALDAPHVVQLFRLRPFPLDALNEALRELARPELRFEGYATNFTDPFISRSELAPAILERHIEGMRERVRAGRIARLGATERVLTRLVENTHAAAPRTRILFVLTPLHPELGEAAGGALDTARTSLAALAQRLDASFVDDSSTFPVELFSDALHLSADGRAAWSARLGTAAAPLLGN